MSKKIAIMLADGFEEVEALTPADVLRRLGYEVILAGVGGNTIRGTHRIYVNTDIQAEQLQAQDLDCIVLPGGLPGAHNLRDSETVQKLVKAVYANGGIAAAICAAPVALHRAGLTQGRRIAGYPGSEKGTDLVYTGNMTESDDRIVTGKGPGAAFAFAFLLAKELGTSDAAAEQLKNGMFVKL